MIVYINFLTLKVNYKLLNLIICLLKIIFPKFLVHLCYIHWTNVSIIKCIKIFFLLRLFKLKIDLTVLQIIISISVFLYGSLTYFFNPFN